jgi:hypothetical protein
LTRSTETILMGSAFEQLMRGDASAYILSKRFGERFADFASVTVEEAKAVRPDIRIDAAPTDARSWRAWKILRRWLPECGAIGRVEGWIANRFKAAQLTWPVHRIWINELYDVRSKVVHKGTAATRLWGWSEFEHLVMAAHVFPLAAKLLLAYEKHYDLTADDRVRCLIVDKILASPRWAEDRSGKSELSWAKILSATESHESFEAALRDIRRTHPELFR